MGAILVFQSLFSPACSLEAQLAADAKVSMCVWWCAKGLLPFSMCSLQELLDACVSDRASSLLFNVQLECCQTFILLRSSEQPKHLKSVQGWHIGPKWRVLHQIAPPC